MACASVASVGDVWAFFEVTHNRVPMFSSSPLAMGIVAVVLSAVLLLSIRPTFMFDANGRFRAFGPGASQTLLPFWLAVLLAGVSVYYVSV